MPGQRPGLGRANVNSLIIFFSYTGRTHYEAKRLWERVGGELYEIWEQKHRSRLSAYLFGPGQARRRAVPVIEPVAVSLDEYDKIYILCPIWGGWPAPAFNAIVRELTPGADVELIFTSDSGRMKDINAVAKRVELQGVRVTGAKVVKTENLMKRERRHFKKIRKTKREAKNG